VNAAGIRVRVNGREVAVAEPTLLAALAQARFAERRGVAVAVNGRVIARPQWPATPVASGDEVLVVQATQGG
jgi:sulfur carrier protein